MKSEKFQLESSRISLVTIVLTTFAALVCLFIRVDIHANAWTKNKYHLEASMLQTPFYLLLFVGLISMIVISICSLRKKELLAYLLVPVSIIITLFCLQSTMFAGNISIVLKLSAAEKVIRIIQVVLELAALISVLLLASNVVKRKANVIAILIASMISLFVTQAYTYQNNMIGERIFLERSQYMITAAAVLFLISVVAFVRCYRVSNCKE